MNLNLRKILAWVIDLTMIGLFLAALILALSSCAPLQGLPLRPARFPVKVILIEFNPNDSGYLYGYGLLDMKKEFYYHSCNEKIELDSVFLTHESLMKTKDYKLINHRNF